MRLSHLADTGAAANDDVQAQRDVWAESLWPDQIADSSGRRGVAPRSCDRHGNRLTGENPVMALGRREHVGEGKGARRNARVHLMDEGTSGKGPHGRQ